MRFVLFKFIYGRRAGAHQAHVALEDVPELGQLVDAGVADEMADAFNDARVVVHLEHLALHLVLLHQLLFPLLRVGVHGAEFVNAEFPAIFADPVLREESRSRRFDADGRGHEDEGNSREEQPHKGAADIHDPLEEKLHHAGGLDAGRDHGPVAHPLDLFVGICLQGLLQAEMNHYAHTQELIGDGMRPCRIAIHLQQHLVHNVETRVFHKGIQIRHHRNAEDRIRHVRRRLSLIPQDKSCHVKGLVLRLQQAAQTGFGVPAGADHQQLPAIPLRERFAHAVFAQGTKYDREAEVQGKKIDPEQTRVYLCLLRENQVSQDTSEEEDILLEDLLRLFKVSPSDDVAVAVKEEGNQDMKAYDGKPDASV